MHSLVAKAQELTDVEEIRTRRVRHPQIQERKRQNNQEQRRQSYKKPSRAEHNKQPNFQKPTQPVYQRFKPYIPLNIELEQILNAIAHEPYVKRLHPI